MISPDPSNNIFQQAVAFVNQTNRHLFITGKAGTGKTTFLKYIKENGYKKMAVVAPTGVAAINAGGVTIHSFFQLPFGSFIPSLRNAFGSYTDGINNPATLLQNLKLAGTKKDLIRELEVLVIDEVSMVRADLLDAIDVVLQHIRKKQGIPFGGVQMIYIGDLFQLPPVVKREEWNLIREYYNSPFFFSALSIQKSPPLYIELKKIYRQKDDVFIDILNNIRNNCCTSNDLEILHRNYRPAFSPEESEGYITLTSHNEKADAINQRELARLSAKSHAFEATITGEFYDRQFPAEKMLYLKEGAQVMFIKNDKGDSRRYFNGKIGKITSILSKKIIISFPGEGKTIELEEEIWQNIRYNYDHVKDKVIEEEQGTFKQYPIRLAWAITIHKSQGLTFEKAIIDAGASFAPGQVYVSLSRLTSLAGLVLYSQILPDAISTDSRVIDFVNTELNEDRLSEILQQDQGLFINYSLVEIFSWYKLLESAKDHYESYDHRLVPNKAACVVWARELIRIVEEQEKVASTFRIQLENLISMGMEGQEKLSARVSSASAYFCKQIDDVILPHVKNQIERMKSHKKVRSYIDSLQLLKVTYERKKEKIKEAVEIANAYKTGIVPVKKIENIVNCKDPEPYIPAPVYKRDKPAKGDSSKLTLQMFRAGKTTSDIAKERGITHSTTYSHLIEFIKSGEVDILEVMDEDKLQKLTRELSLQPEQTLTELKQKLPEDISYDDIRAAKSYTEFKKAGKVVSEKV